MPKPHVVQPGDKFARLTVLGYHDSSAAKKRRYLCRCDCGKETVVVGGNLKSGNARSCGCLQREVAAATGAAIAGVRIAVGDEFGLLTVVALATSTRRGQAKYRCECACGGEVVTLAASLRNGRTTSCGCVRRATAAQRGRANAKHGHATSGTRAASAAYHCWANLIARCTNPNHKSYEHYGGRGITVCPEWRASFERFLSEMGEPPQGRSIDRIDNSAGYSKANCRWATPKEQAANRRPPRKSP